MRNIKSLAQKGAYTYDDYAKLPEGAPYELINGQLIEEPSPTPYHQDLVMKLSNLIYNHLQVTNDLGKVFTAPLDVYLEHHETFQPDIIFVGKERKPIIGEKMINGAPDLVIEILSPATAYYDLRHKKRVYAKQGVQEYWIVDPKEQSIEVYTQSNGEFSFKNGQIKEGHITSTILKGLIIPLEELFRNSE